MQCERLETYMWLKGVDLVRNDVEVSWMNSIMKGWRIKTNPELSPGA